MRKKTILPLFMINYQNYLTIYYLLCPPPPAASYVSLTHSSHVFVTIMKVRLSLPSSSFVSRPRHDQRCRFVTPRRSLDAVFFFALLVVSCRHYEEDCCRLCHSLSFSLDGIVLVKVIIMGKVAMISPPASSSAIDAAGGSHGGRNGPAVL
jgi:hypothetical protein